MLEDNPELLTEDLQPDTNNNGELANKALVGKIRANKVFNVKAMIDIISKAWVGFPGLQISELGNNMFLFSFAKKEDREDVLRKAPWFFMNQLMCLEVWLRHVSYDQI